MNRRKQLLLPSPLDFLYKEALSEPCNSVKFHGKPFSAGAFNSDGVKKSLPALYQKLVGMMAPLPEIDTI